MTEPATITPEEFRAISSLRRALGPMMVIPGPMSATIGSDVLADVSAAMLDLGRPISPAVRHAMLMLVVTIRGEIL